MTQVVHASLPVHKPVQCGWASTQVRALHSSEAAIAYATEYANKATQEDTPAKKLRVAFVFVAEV